MRDVSQIVGNLSTLSIKKSDPEEQSSKNVHVMFPLPKQDPTITFFGWLIPEYDTKVTSVGKFSWAITKDRIGV